MNPEQSIKIVGHRRTVPLAGDPVGNYERAIRLIREMDLVNPFPRPRGFIFKARTWQDYAAWRRAQTNPRLW
jgi:hypothetical protein